MGQFFGGFICGILCCLATWTTATANADSGAHGVPLWRATTPPTYAQYLKPNNAWEFVCPDGGSVADVGVYRWNGRALGSPRARVVAGYIVLAWRWVGRGFVTYDGHRFTNRTDRPVLAAAWCNGDA